MWGPEELLKSIETAIWRNPPPSASAWKRLLLRVVRVGVVLVRDIAQGQLTLRAIDRKSVV